MSWTRTLQRGSGELRWRLAIDGYPYQAVSHRAMARGVGETTLSTALGMTTTGNLLPAPGSETWGTSTGATVTTGQPDPAGGTAGRLIAETSGTLFAFGQCNNVGYTSGSPVWGSLWIRQDIAATTFCEVRVGFDLAWDDGFVFHPGDGRHQVRIGSFVGIEAKLFSGWWIVSFRHAGKAASAVSMRFYPAMGAASAFPTIAAAQVGAHSVYGPRLADASSSVLTSTTVEGRYLGLRSESIELAEEVHLPTARWEARGFSARLADIDQRWTECFTRRPTVTTYLADASVTSSDATIELLSGTGLPATNGVIYIDTEAIRYVSRTDGTLSGCSRGSFGSLAQYHYSEGGARLRYAAVTDWPESIEGRRVRLYVYGSGDDPQGDGTQVWAGVARTEPSFNGAEWSFLVDGLSSVLDADLGADVDEPRTIRGAYYARRTPIYVLIEEMDGAGRFGAQSAATTLGMAGFWENNEDFCAALTSAMQAAMADPISGTFTQLSLAAEPHGDSWRLTYTPAATPRYLKVYVHSAVDGSTDALWRNPALSPTAPVVAGTTYTIDLIPIDARVPDPGTVPRMCIHQAGGPLDLALRARRQIDLDETLFPSNRFYLAAPPPAGATTVLLTMPPTDGVDTVSFDAPVISVDSGSRSVVLNTSAAPIGLGQNIVVTASSVERVTMEFSLELGTGTGVGTLATLISSILTLVPQYLNTGAVPFLRPTSGGVLSDFDLSTSPGGGGAEIAAAVAAGGSVTAGRRYTLLAKTNLRDLIEHECRLLGVYPCLNASGQITFRRLRLPSASEAASASGLDSRTIVTDESMLSYERQPYGSYNTVIYKLGYDPAEDESTATPVKVRDVTAFGKTPMPRVLEVEPKSVDPEGPIALEDLVRLASRVLGTFGGSYATLTVDVPLTLFSRLLGDPVAVTYRKVPSGRVDEEARSRGLLGADSVIGLVASRRFEPMRGRGRLTVLLTDQRIGGYAPASRVTAVSGTSGTTGPFVLTLSSHYFPAGTTAEDFFEAGYAVRVYLRDTTVTTSNRTGTVTAVSGNDVTITVSSAWVPSGDIVLGYDVSTAITEDGQKVHVAIARSTARVTWGAGSDPAFTFGP